MAKFETLEELAIYNGFCAAVHGMRHPFKSGAKSDSYWEDGKFVLGEKDYNLAKSLYVGGPEHRKWMRMITVWVDIEANRGWWQEFATYSVGTTANSESTMHTIMRDPLTLESFELPQWFGGETYSNIFKEYVNTLNEIRARYKVSENDEEKSFLLQIIKCMLPEGFLQKRTVRLNYEVLRTMYAQRKNHKLPQWNTDFCSWVKTLPYSEFITGEFDKD